MTAPELPNAPDAPAVGAQVQRPVRPQSVGTRLGDISDLPPQLRALLAKTPTLVDQVREALKALEGIATTDELLVMVYRKTGRVCQRRPFEVMLYSAAARGRIGLLRLRAGRSNRRSGLPSKAWTLDPNATDRSRTR